MKISKLARLGLRWSALALGVLALTVLSNPSAKTNWQSGLIPPDVMKLMAVYGADTATIDRNARDYKLPDQIEWKGRPGSGRQSAILFGDPSKPGNYVRDIANQTHFDGSKADGLTIEIVGMGPATSTQAEAK